MLRLPFRCEQPYKERLIKLNLLPLTYWHEHLELTYFFKIVNGLVDVNQSIVPRARSARPTRSSANSASTQYLIRKCKTTTFQKSYFNRCTRIWNNLTNVLDRSSFSSMSSFRNALMNYYSVALSQTYDPEDPRTWKTV